MYADNHADAKHLEVQFSGNTLKLPTGNKNNQGSATQTHSPPHQRHGLQRNQFAQNSREAPDEHTEMEVEIGPEFVGHEGNAETGGSVFFPGQMDQKGVGASTDDEIVDENDWYRK